MLDSCAWMTWPSKVPGKRTMSTSQIDWDTDPHTEFYPVEGPASTPQLVIKAIKLMKCGKVAGTSLIVAEMLKASGVEGAQQIRDLIEDIIHFGKIPTELEESIIISLYKDKDVALERWNFRGLKLLDKVMKVLDRVAENFLQHLRFDDMQFDFMPGCSTTDAIFIIHCTAVTRNVPCRQQDTVHGLFQHGKGIGVCIQTCHLVSPSQAWHRGVAGAAHREHVWKC